MTTRETTTLAPPPPPASFTRRIAHALKLRLHDPIERVSSSTSTATTSSYANVDAHASAMGTVDVAACVAALSDVLATTSGAKTSSGTAQPQPTTRVGDIRVRAVVERRAASLREMYLDESLRAQSKLTQVESTLAALDEAREKMRHALESSRSSTGTLLREADRAREALASIESRRALANDFAVDFQLTKSHVEALVGDGADDGGDLGAAFFQALDRVKVIQGNCAKLNDTDQRRAGLELMDVMTSYAESAHERLCKWVVAKCRRLAEEDDFISEADEKMLTKSVAALRLRPTLFKHCVEEVTRTRHNALFRDSSPHLRAVVRARSL